MMLNYTEMMREDLERQSAALRDILAFATQRMNEGTVEYANMQHIKSVAQDALKGGA